MAFSPDGDFLAAAAGDGTTRIWRTPTGAPTPPVSTDWKALSAELRTRTTACLTRQDRIRLLGETDEEARAASDSCLGSFGLKSLTAPRAAGQ
jgi:WD40 repeat protein